MFVDGLPASWDEDRVRELLKKFGGIEKVELARNMPSARRKDFGFVSFDSHDAAVTCAKSINNAELGEGDHKAKVRARLSRPSQRGKGKSQSRGDRKGGARAPGRRLRAPWNRPLPRPRPARARGVGNRVPPAPNRGFKRPIGLRDRRPPPTPIPARPRPLPPPPRSYERRAPALPPPKSSLKRDYHRREELPPRSSRAVAEYPSRLPPERRPSYSHRDEYAGRAPAYSDVHRSSASRSASRRSYADDSYAPRYERPPPSYREGRARDYDSISGSKRSYSAMDDVPSRYGDSSHGVRHSRARLDYDMPASQYGDSYSDRLGRSSAGYGSSSRSSVSAQDSHGLYSSRQGMSYNGSYGGSDVGGGVYSSSSYGGEYTTRGSDVGGSSYSSLYSSRGMGSSSYMGGGSSGSYY